MLSALVVVKTKRQYLAVASGGDFTGAVCLADTFASRLVAIQRHQCRVGQQHVAYSLSNAIFSGCAGLIITGLIKQTGNLDIPAYYVMATAVVSIFALMTLNKDDHLRSLEE